MTTSRDIIPLVKLLEAVTAAMNAGRQGLSATELLAMAGDRDAPPYDVNVDSFLPWRWLVKNTNIKPEDGSTIRKSKRVRRLRINGVMRYSLADLRMFLDVHLDNNDPDIFGAIAAGKVETPADPKPAAGKPRPGRE